MQYDPDFGYITLAFGAQRYVDQATALAYSLKMHMPGAPIAIITDHDHVDPVFDKIVKINPAHGMGTLQKAWLDDYSPYQKTMFIDSDCLVTRPFEKEFQDITKFEFTPVMGRFLGLNDSDDLYIEDLAPTLKTYGADYFCKFNGGIYYFEKGPLVTALMAEARSVATRAKELGLKSFDKGGAADETIIGLAMAKHNLRDLYSDHGDLMRTPIGITGDLNIDVLGGGCHFLKWGSEVRPAICHFAAPYSKYSPYAYNCWLVRHPNTPEFMRKMARNWFRLERKIKNKIAERKVA